MKKHNWTCFALDLLWFIGAGILSDGSPQEVRSRVELPESAEVYDETPLELLARLEDVDTLCAEDRTVYLNHS